jgi:large subunit ribosomal protein L9
MKILLLKDVYNLGRAGEVKKVANGYGRNYLLPQRLAVLATPGALTQIDRIAAEANKRRNVLNEEMGTIAEKMVDLMLLFPARAGETGKLYGSVTTAMIAEAISKEIGVEISKRQIDSQPVRLLGMHILKARLTMDIIPEFKVVVYREGESPENYMILAEDLEAGIDPNAVEEVAEDVVEDVVAEDAEIETEDAAEVAEEEEAEEAIAEAAVEAVAELEAEAVEEEAADEATDEEEAAEATDEADTAE